MERIESGEDRTPWAPGSLGTFDCDGLSAEEIGRYEDFLRSSVDWLWETDAALSLTHVSSPVALKLGIPARVLIGRPLLRLGRFEAAHVEAPGSAQSGLQSAQAAIEARRPFRDARFVMTGADKGDVTYRFSGVPYFDEETGAFRGYRGTALSAPATAPWAAAREAEAETLAKELESALIREQDLTWRLSRLEETQAAEVPGQAVPGQPVPEQTAADQIAAEQAAGESRLARTAHELRTPLNAIVGYADLALKQMFGPLGERYVDCFRTIREAGRHMEHLVSHLRADGPAAGTETLARDKIDVTAIVAQAKAMIALAAKSAEVDISRVGPLSGGRVIGDSMACTQILVNLLNNAVKFTPAGGSVGLETLVGADNNLQIAVWDTGIGIPEDEQAKIFESSYRGSEVTGGAGPSGLGLGLAISRELARAMGGDITVASQPGQGARFILSLPLAAEPKTSDG